ncbi:MAG TPA: PilZ domain-containing protein [Candidatus Solibacter sp.]|nr:PilZ domain-containing protein [Candidatus Solibacter sp.]
MLLETQSRSKANYPNGGVQRHPRALFSVPIAIRHLMAGGVQTTRGVSLDISESGLGALVQGVLHVGDTVTINMNLPEHTLNAVAIVRHSSTVRSGFEFLGLSADERARLAKSAARVPAR